MHVLQVLIEETTADGATIPLGGLYTASVSDIVRATGADATRLAPYLQGRAETLLGARYSSCSLKAVDKQGDKLPLDLSGDGTVKELFLYTPALETLVLEVTRSEG